MKGKISAGVFKVMAVVSALALGGGYVGWRQMEAEKAKERGRIEQVKAEEDMTLIVGSKSLGGTFIKQGDVTEGGILPPLEEEGGEKALLLSGSKSYTGGTLLKKSDFIEPIPGVPDGAEDVSNGAPLLPGSKSISMPLFTKDQLKQLRAKDEGEKEVEIVPAELLPSSKIGILRLREKEVEPPAEKEKSE